MIEAVARWQTLARVYFGGAPFPELFHSVRKGATALTPQAALFENKEAAVTADLAISERVSQNMMRHAYAIHMHSGSVDLHVLQESLGHAGIETARI